jgi:AcrR family transcriptional regulator
MTPTRQRARRGEGSALREEILTATRELLAETGSEEAVSIRAVADRVGVSTPAIYLHFADKDALIAEVCNQVFAALDAAMEAAARATEDPMESLRERGLAYVRFAIANPEHYRLVLMRRPADAESIDPSDEMLAEGAFAHLLAAVGRCQDAGLIRADENRLALGLVLWAAAHGIASLAIAKPGLPWPDLDAVIRRTIDAIGCGLSVTSLDPDYQGGLASRSSQLAPAAHSGDR